MCPRVGTDLGDSAPAGKLVLHSFETCERDKRAFAENFHWIETHANMLHPDTIIEPVGDGYVQINPPYPPATQEEMDSFWDLPFTKLPHPRYKGKRIPAYDMIKFSVNTHRGCFGGCNFCTIAAHQGKFITSRSEESILKEVRELNDLPDFAGNISDVGAPTANMYGMHGKDESLCAKCRRRSCLYPAPCPNLDRDHTRLLNLYHRIDATKGIRHSYIGSGIRYDLFLDENGYVDASSRPYRPDQPGGGDPCRACPVLHIEPSRLHAEGHAAPRRPSRPEGNLDGPGPGFHPDADDYFVRHVLDRTGPPGHASGVHGTRSGAQTRAEITFLQKFFEKFRQRCEEFKKFH